MPLDASFFARTSTVASKLLFIGQLEDRSFHVYLLRSRFLCIRVQRSFAVCRFRKITTKDVSYKTCLHNGDPPATFRACFVGVFSASLSLPVSWKKKEWNRQCTGKLGEKRTFVTRCFCRSTKLVSLPLNVRIVFPCKPINHAFKRFDRREASGNKNTFTSELSTNRSK